MPSLVFHNVSVDPSERFSEISLVREFGLEKAATVYDSPWKPIGERAQAALESRSVTLVLKDPLPEVAAGKLFLDQCRGLPLDQILRRERERGLVPADLHELIGLMRTPNLLESLGKLDLIAPGSLTRSHRNIEGYPFFSSFEAGGGLFLWPRSTPMDLMRNPRILFRELGEGQYVELELPPKPGDSFQEYAVEVFSTADPSGRAFERHYASMDPLWLKGVSRRHPSLRHARLARGKRTVCLKSFDRWISSRNAMRWGKRRGYRLAFPCEREAFVTQHYRATHGTWIVDHGTVHHDGRFRLHPVILQQSEGVTELYPHLQLHWHPGTRIMFVRE